MKQKEITISKERQKEIEKELSDLHKKTESVKISTILVDAIRKNKKVTGVSVRTFVELAVMSKLPLKGGKEIQEIVHDMCDVGLGTHKVKKVGKKLKKVKA